MMQGAADDLALDIAAARVALVALFGAVPSYETVSADRVRVEPDAALLTFEQAARLLALMPKPFVCVAENARGTLHVTGQILAELPDVEQQRLAWLRDNGGEQRDLFHYIIERYGEGDHRIAAYGHEQTAVVSLAAAQRWHRDYHHDFVSWSADDTANDLAQKQPEYIDALRRGAKGILRFSSPADHVTTPDAEHFQFPLPDSATPDDRRKLENGLIELARSQLLAIEDEEALSAVERELVERGELPADSLVRHGRNPWPYVHRVMASQMRKFFEGRAMPPEVEAFVDACRPK
ncbi:MAG TPA: hypothetical protein VN717_05265 [Gemmatimonadaceae bacterium]|nr:hypothetical protein [Gemmatimonadaceae bacterium]